MKEKLFKIAIEEDEKTLKQIKKRIQNRDALKESQQIALKVLLKLNELNWSQKDLANKMQVSPQQINKIVSGKENLTIETLVKLQKILNIKIFASEVESKNNHRKRSIPKSN